MPNTLVEPITVSPWGWMGWILRLVTVVLGRFVAVPGRPLRDGSADTDVEPTPLPNHAETTAPAPPSAAQVLTSLMDQSMRNSPDQSRATLHRTLIGAVVPDEARILAALADGHVYPVVHVAAAGSGSTWLVQNASTVGRAAGVSLPQHTPWYLTRLLSLGLVCLGPEVPSLRDDYEMLLTDSAVHVALTSGRRGVRPARTVRASVRMSDLGRELWEAVT